VSWLEQSEDEQLLPTTITYWPGLFFWHSCSPFSSLCLTGRSASPRD
jgi:hypothetical protein